MDHFLNLSYYPHKQAVVTMALCCLWRQTDLCFHREGFLIYFPLIGLHLKSLSKCNSDDELVPGPVRG